MRFMLGPWRVRRREKSVVSSVEVSLDSELVLSFSGFAFEGVDLTVGGNCR